MDFGLYPPEINSGRMYTGPGSGPLLAAAQAWGGLADELDTAASSYQSVVAGLTAQAWSGPSSTSMAAAADSHVAWLAVTAAQAEETANQARAAVAAYEAAFAATVPPEVVAANRSLLMVLVATNFFGQNTPAIAATEAQYAEMWAQDAAAMYGYAGSSAAATTLTPFSAPQQNTTSAGQAAQAAAVNNAASTSAGNAQSTVSSIQQGLSAVPNALQSLATSAPAQAADPLGTLSNLITVFLSTPASLTDVAFTLPADILGGPIDLPFSVGGFLTGVSTDNVISGWNGEEVWPGTGPAPVQPFPAIVTNSGQSAVGPTLSAGLGEADTVGALSVPQAWTMAAPELRSLAYALPAAGDGAAATAAVEASSGSTFSELGLAAMTGRAMAGPPNNSVEDAKPTIGRRVAAFAGEPTPDSTGEASHANPRIVVTGVAARIRDIAKLRDEGRLTEEEYTEQKRRLLGR